MGKKQYLKLEVSEGIVVQVADQVYSADIAAGRVTEDSEKEWMNRSVREASRIARVVDETVQSDGELG
jgi:hypothetical protein